MEGWFYAGQPKTIAKPKQLNYIKHCTHSVLKSSFFSKTRFEFFTFQHLKRNKEKSALRRRKWTRAAQRCHFVWSALSLTRWIKIIHIKTRAHVKAKMNWNHNKVCSIHTPRLWKIEYIFRSIHLKVMLSAKKNKILASSSKLLVLKDLVAPLLRTPGNLHVGQHGSYQNHW